jgi:formylglycine-generating enzyme required for sulfatase activity
MKKYFTPFMIFFALVTIGYGYTYSDYTWYSYNGHQYAATFTMGNWEDVQAEAAANSWNLVTINNSDVNGWLAKKFDGISSFSAVWIGLQKIDEVWVWVSGEPISYGPNWCTWCAGYGSGIHAYLHTASHEGWVGTWNNNITHDTVPDYYLPGIIEIVPIKVVSPNGGENWIAGTTQKIQWETIPGSNIVDVNIQYSANNGLIWNDINTVPNTGSYNWLVPPVNSNQCLVRISDAADANVFDTSDNTFIIYQCRLNSKADLDGNCKVDMTDLALFANDWMRNGNPFDQGYTEGPAGMVWVSINEPNFTGYMSKYETTNAQYCEFLNAAKASGDITVDGNNVFGASGSNSGADFVGQPYYNLAGAGENLDGATNGGAARINYSGGSFSVESGFENHPVTYVTWYGATAFCNYYGYRLPTEWEWQAVADYDGSYTYGCGTSINNGIANYLGSTHPDGTTVVGSFGTYGYGMCDMTGNVWEWTSTVSGDYRILRGVSWLDFGNLTVSQYHDHYPASNSGNNVGFRVCR